MNATSIVRAWKDPEYRARLSSEQRLALPENPSGRPMTELGEGELEAAVGGCPGTLNTLNRDKLALAAARTLGPRYVCY